jgi:hypothetical protein
MLKENPHPYPRALARHGGASHLEAPILVNHAQSRIMGIADG